MGIMGRGTATITMLQADQKALKSITLDNLKRHAIGPIEIGGAEKATGFAPIADPFGMNWGGSPRIGEFTAFCFRMDSKKVPASVLTLHLQEALKKERKESASEMVSRKRKKELKELIKARLLSEAETAPAVYEIVVNQAGVVYLGANSNSVIAAVQDVFAACFRCNLTEMLTVEEQGKASDFLTQIVKEGFRAGDVALSAAGAITVANEDTKLTGTSKSDNDIQEIQAAIVNGMKVTQTGIQINAGDPEACTLTLASTFRISKMKLPAAEKQDDDNPDAAFLERMFLIEKFTGVLLDAFRAF
jgi:DNA recombination-dependent growth factor C